jgi:Flp pilus assembly protein protease CpaA
MIDRIFRNRKTTILGLLILIISFILVWFEKATLTEVSLFLTGGFAMLFVKDPVIKKGEN